MMKHLLLLALCLVIGCAAQTERGHVMMKNDERAIRQWFEQWMKATKEGELELALSLIADDAVSLVPGAGRMDKESFAAAATASDPNTDFKLDCAIQEIEVFGDYAWIWTQSTLTMTDTRKKSRSMLAGHSLSVLKRPGGRWVVIRDANTLAPVEQSA